ncbi:MULTISPECIES: RluA family pseudouridine synthase [Clostridium]|uniref:RluA family pseudouridine synthase n=1 Tax=Clostridium TaxID=1485 RepID=UPI0008266490|nr:MULTISPECIES: RluA family pseudouridine synthase [Clostridium]PJI09909.1 RluA family pseudouridine synthase [Clostridium sp. CT7]
MEKFNFTTEESNDNERIDVYLSSKFTDISRSYIQELIKKKSAIVNGKIVKSNHKLKAGDNITFEFPDNEELKVDAEDIPLDIVYEDSDIIVVNKQQGMVVHPAPGNYSGTLVNALLYHCNDLSGINGVLRPGIVHRIDKDTSGVIVVAKNDAAHKKLAYQLKEHSMNRVYKALVEGIIKEDEGIVDKPLGRHPVERIKIAVVKNGRKAVTHYKVIERYKNNTLVECKLETGRTHQIRVHMAYIGHPLVGDPVYGYKKQRFNLNGQMLHAQKLGFVHPRTGKYVEFNSKLPAYFERIIGILKNELK